MTTALAPTAGAPWPPAAPPVDVDREAAREAAERELSREVYTQYEPNLFQRFVDWAWGHLSSLLDGFGFQPPGGLAGLLLLALLVTALVIALRLRLGALRDATRTGRREPLHRDSHRTAADHRNAADQHAAAGRWEDAVRERTRALVRDLEERTVLDTRPGRTADEAAREAGTALPDHADRLRDAARTFDAVTYGGRPASHADHARVADLDRDVQRTRPQHAVQPAPTAAGAAR